MPRNDARTPEEKLLEGICQLSPNAEPLTEGERDFLLSVLRGELEGIPDRFTGNAISNVSINTPEQQKIVDEWNAQFERDDPT